MKFPWLAGGKRVVVPELTLGDQYECRRRHVQRLRALGLGDDTPQIIRDEILETADLAYIADVAFTRLQKADPALTYETFEQHVNTRPAVLIVASTIAGDGPGKERAPTRGHAREAGKQNWKTWMRTLMPWRKPPPPGDGTSVLSSTSP